MFKHISLTVKMILITVIAGAATWSLLDPLQTRTIKETFQTQLTDKLREDTHESRMLFDRYINAFHQNARIIVTLKQFSDYAALKKGEWSTPADHGRIQFLKRIPPWLPKPSILRTFPHFHYALLIDSNGRTREVYMNVPESPPLSLLQPEHILLQFSHQQNLMTMIDGIPYLITSESLLNAREKVLATLMLASPLDNEFLSASQGSEFSENIVALVEGTEPRILASNKVDLLPTGTPLSSVRDTYLFEGKDFFDYGASDLHMELTTFIPKNQFELLSTSILMKERKNRIIAALFLIASFSLITVWITKRIQALTSRVTEFAEETLYKKQPVFYEGDELIVLEERFQNLTHEVVASHDSLKRQAESLRAERDRAQNYLDIAGTIILALNTKGNVTLINKKGCEVLEYREGEIIGKNWIDCFIQEGFRKSAHDAFEILMEGKKERHRNYENHILTKSGDERIISWHNAVLRDEEGALKGILSSGEDITDRRKLEETIMNIDDRERRRIGQDLHDSLGQMLTGIAFKVRGIGRKLEKSSIDVAEDAAEISILIDEAKEQVSHLAKGLSPVELGSEGLIAALEDLASYAEKIFDIPCAFKYDDTVSVQSKTSVSQLYRIAQEAVTNAVKHGNPTAVEISLCSENGNVVLTVRDDGIGIPDTAGHTNGMGLKIMHYRADLVNASLDIEREARGGTIVRCTLHDFSK